MIPLALRDLLAVGTMSGTTRFSPRSISKLWLLKVALTSRILILLAMAISCALLPNHNPGDDVFQFPLRFPGNATPCFCLKGQACDVQWKLHSTATNRIMIEEECADDSNTEPHSLIVVHAVYKFLLTPLTRWDAARFLDLAVYPFRRDPPRLSQHDFPHCTTSTNNNNAACQELFLPTEQAHAFFPLLPLVIRTIANGLKEYIPRAILPPTFEGVVTLAALLWNMLCFVLASIALYELTLGLIQQQQQFAAIHAKKLPPLHYYFSRDQQQQQAAYQVFLLFCINPASIFFTTAYSESMFAACNFGGHCLLVRGLVPFLELLQWQFEVNDNNESVKPKRAKTQLLLPNLLRLLAYMMVAVALWMAGSYTRSNGSINSAWLLLLGMGLFGRFGIRQGQYRAAVVLLGICVLLAVLVALPVYWHDTAGYQRHCLLLYDNDTLTPTWCNNNSDTRFSLYGYVQRQHWNVGLFRYYTWKKIPNFMFAAPILVLSISAVVDWIYNSYTLFRGLSDHQEPPATANVLFDKCRIVILWAISSLQASVPVITGSIDDPKKSDKESSSEYHHQEMRRKTDLYILMGPFMLGHYAVLAAVCIVGLTVAHVEITTRMICSTCPAVYWYMALCCRSWEQNGVADGKKEERTSNLLTLPLLCQRAVIPYCFLFILVGVLLHPNWLPWT